MEDFATQRSDIRAVEVEETLEGEIAVLGAVVNNDSQGSEADDIRASAEPGSITGEEVKGEKSLGGSNGLDGAS